MKFDKEKLLNLLYDLDQKVNKKILIVLIGGSAISYFNLKDKTKDVDFLYGGIEFEEIYGLIQELSHEYGGVRIDIWSTEELLIHSAGRINTQKLPPDYLSLCDPVHEKFKNIVVVTLNPLDIVLTKVARLSRQDQIDITVLVKHYNLSRKVLEQRLKLYVKGYDGNPNKMISNFKHLMELLYEE